MRIRTAYQQKIVRDGGPGLHKKTIPCLTRSPQTEEGQYTHIDPPILEFLINYLEFEFDHLQWKQSEQGNRYNGKYAWVEAYK